MPRLPVPSRSALMQYVARGRLVERDLPAAAQIVKPGPGQESVWDFPRPPRVEDVAERIRVVAFGKLVADSSRGIRVLETAGAPCYYVPPADCDTSLLAVTSDWSICEWKGAALAYDIACDERVARAAAWSYPEPLTDLGIAYDRIAGYFAFYAARVDACYVGAERVRPQGGGYYGGWVRANLTGPIKGDPGSGNW